MQATPGDTGRRRLAFADGLRGLAALWVLLFHLSTSGQVDAVRAGLPAAANRALFDWGHGGVAVFFVLSGFVMALTAAPARMDGAAAGRFMVRRLVRVCPPYWLAVAVFGALVLARGGELHPAQVLAHLLFLQDVLGYPQINIVFWTLGIEIQFYLAFAALTWLSDALAGPAARGAVRAAVAVLALAWPLGLVATSLWPGGFLHLWVFFMAGVLVQDARRGRRIFSVAFACGLLLVAGWRHDLYSGIAGCTSLALLAADVGSGMQKWLAGAALQRLGLVSYSLYLFHTLAIAVVGHFWRPSGGDGVATDATRAAITLASSMGLAGVAWWSVERVSIAWSHRWAGSTTAPDEIGEPPAPADGSRQVP